jgi:hypothetical protein
MALRHSGGGSGRNALWHAYDSGMLAAGLLGIGSALAIGLAIGSSKVSCEVVTGAACTLA